MSKRIILSIPEKNYNSIMEYIEKSYTQGFNGKYSFSYYKRTALRNIFLIGMVHYIKNKTIHNNTKPIPEYLRIIYKTSCTLKNGFYNWSSVEKIKQWIL